MKKLLPLFILLFAVASFGQHDRLEVKYDKFKENTRVRAALAVASIPTTISFDYDGNVLRKDIETFYIFFYGGSRCSGFCFNEPGLIFLMDGDKRWTIGKQSNRLSDSALFSLTRREMQMLADSKTVELQVGRYEGKFEPRDIEVIKEMIAAGTVKK